MVVATPKGQVVHITSQLADLLGLSRHQAVATFNMESLLIEPFAQLHRTHLAVSAQGARSRLRFCDLRRCHERCGDVCSLHAPCTAPRRARTPPPLRHTAAARAWPCCCKPWRPRAAPSPCPSA